MKSKFLTLGMVVGAMLFIVGSVAGCSSCGWCSSSKTGVNKCAMGCNKACCAKKCGANCTKACCAKTLTKPASSPTK